MQKFLLKFYCKVRLKVLLQNSFIESSLAKPIESSIAKRSFKVLLQNVLLKVLSQTVLLKVLPRSVLLKVLLQNVLLKNLSQNVPLKVLSQNVPLKVLWQTGLLKVQLQKVRLVTGSTTRETLVTL